MSSQTVWNLLIIDGASATLSGLVPIHLSLDDSDGIVKLVGSSERVTKLIGRFDPYYLMHVSADSLIFQSSLTYNLWRFQRLSTRVEDWMLLEEIRLELEAAPGLRDVSVRISHDSTYVSYSTEIDYEDAVEDQASTDSRVWGYLQEVARASMLDAVPQLECNVDHDFRLAIWYNNRVKVFGGQIDDHPGVVPLVGELVRLIVFREPLSDIAP